MKKFINYTKWTKTYHTPHISIIIDKDYIQVSFIVLCYHFWIIINKTKQP